MARTHFHFSLVNVLLALAVFFSCFASRYAGLLKIRIGIYISYFTLAALLLLILRFKRIIHLSYSMVFLCIWVLSVILDLWKTEAINNWGYYFLYIISALIFYMFLQNSNSLDSFRIIAKVISISLIIHLTFGFYEIISHTYLFGVEYGDFPKSLYGKVAVTVFHNPNDYSTFVVTQIPFILHFFSVIKNWFWKSILLSIAVLSLVIVFINQSRAAFIALLIMLFAYYLILSKANRYIQWLTPLAIIVFGLIILLIPQFQEIIKSSFTDLFIQTGSDNARINLIKNGLYFLRETNGFGVGAGNLKIWLGTRSIYSVGNLLYMHNWYVEILSTFGIIVFVLYMFFHIRIIKHLYLNAIIERNIFSLSTTYFLSFVCFSFVCIASSSNFYSEWVWMYLPACAAYIEMNAGSDSLID